MTPPVRNVAHPNTVNPDHEAPDETIPDSDETPQPDRTSPVEHHVSDDAAGDEGIDEPAAT